jgi:hypothetical protein
MMMTEMDIETSVYYVHLTRLIAREDFNLNKPSRLALQGLFAKFVNSPYYPESEICGDVVTVSFLKYLPWQVMHFLQQSTQFLKMCCRLLITSKFPSL